MLQSVGVAPFKSTSDCLPSTMEQQHMMGVSIYTHTHTYICVGMDTYAKDVIFSFPFA